MNEWLIAALVLALLLMGVLVVLLLRSRSDPALTARLEALAQSDERLERELRGALDAVGSALRLEQGARVAELQAALTQQLNALGAASAQQIAGFSGTVQQQLSAFTGTTQQQLTGLTATTQQQLADSGTALQGRLADLTAATQTNLAEVRTTLETRLRDLQRDNATRLEEMRKTVDERLHATLEARLGESFKLVSDRLEQVHRGLGEMQSLAVGVGDLKRVLSNVKTRGTFGEAQLSALLAQVLAPEQYAANVATRPGSGERVEFAIRMPGGPDGATMWLPIDAKFPSEDYERLLAAHERVDAGAIEQSARAIETRIRLEAGKIRSKYIEPPHTTDFALLFVPTEGLYAEVLRRPGLFDGLQRDLRVVVVGPTTLYATLASLQMGFRTLALEKRSAEVWQVLGAVKTEFGKFGEVLDKVKLQLNTAANTIDSAQTRTRQMNRALKGVEAMPADEALRVLPPDRVDEG